MARFACGQAVYFCAAMQSVGSCDDHHVSDTDDNATIMGLSSNEEEGDEDYQNMPEDTGATAHVVLFFH